MYVNYLSHVKYYKESICINYSSIIYGEQYEKNIES